MWLRQLFLILSQNSRDGCSSLFGINDAISNVQCINTTLPVAELCIYLLICAIVAVDFVLL